MSSTVLETMQIMKFRTSRQLKNIILSIIIAILTPLKLFVQFSEKMLGSVGMKIFFFSKRP